MKHLKYLLFIAFCALVCTSCDKEDNPDEGWQDSKLCQQLIGTSWQLYSVVFYWNDGTEADRSDRLRPQIYTFTNERANVNYELCKTPFVLEMYNTDSGKTDKGTWFIIGNKWINGNVSPSIQGDVVALTSDCLQLRFDYDDPVSCGCDYSIDYYQRVYR